MGPEMPQPGPGLAPTVGTAVDQAADQAWASATPITNRLLDRRTPDPAGSRGPARAGCHRAWSSRVVRAVPAVDSAKVPACSSPRRFPEGKEDGISDVRLDYSVVGAPQARPSRHPDRSGADQGEPALRPSDASMVNRRRPFNNQTPRGLFRRIVRYVKFTQNGGAPT